MGSLVALSLVFFVVTLRNYTNLQERLGAAALDIPVALSQLDGKNLSDASKDWHMRVLLEHEAMSSRHRQNATVVEASVWTRFMGFMTGMVMVIAGCTFIIGKLEVSFEGSGKLGGNEGALKTNSPGIVLAVVGSVLIAIALGVKVNVEVNDRPVFLSDMQGYTVEASTPLPAPLPLPEMPAPSSPSSKPKGKPAASVGKPPMPAAVAQEICRQAAKPPDCMN